MKLITKLKGKFDEYGQTFEFGDEFQGLFGFREVKVNPERSLQFKVANYQRGVRESRSLFTREALKGGPIEPRDVVDAYINANRSLFEVRKEFGKDLDAAQVLNISPLAFSSATERLSDIDVNTIRNNIFRPIELSNEVQRAFAENALRIGVTNPLITALPAISQLQAKIGQVSLTEPSFPFFENPLLPITQDTPVTPTSLNLPGIDSNIVNNPGAAGSFSNLTTQQKLSILFPQG